MKQLFLTIISVQCFIGVTLSNSLHSIYINFIQSDTTYPKNKVDKVFGYRDIELEQEVSELRKNVQLNEGYLDSGLVMYSVIDKRYSTYKGCQIERTFLSAFNGKILGIYIVSRGSSNNIGILNFLKRNYGPCSMCFEAPINRFDWFGQKAIINFQVNLDEAITYIGSVALQKEFDKLKSK